MIWLVFALLTGAAVFSVLWPLSRPAPSASDDAADVAFYRAQIAEIEAELSRGAIDAAQAENAKAQAGRRLLASAPQEAAQTSAPKNRRLASVLALVAVPLVALGLYTRLGQPDRPDMPLEARLKAQPDRHDFAAAIAKMEAHIAEHPDDGKALELMAPVWLRMGRFDDAIAAREKAIALLGETAERRIRLAEALTAAQNGEIPDKAREQIDRAIALDPKAPEARYFQGLAAAQKGEIASARTTWKALAADLPEGSRARNAIEEKIAQLDMPQGEAAQAVAAQPAAQQQQTIKSMVDGLAARLAEKGGSVEDWGRLIRALKVLNEEGRAKTALADARKAFAQDAGALQKIDGQAKELGLDRK